MQIKQVGMTRNHFQPGDAGRIRMVVLHSTAARGPGDFNYLRQGGSNTNPVSIHYYIAKAGAISQMVPGQGHRLAGRRQLLEGRWARGQRLQPGLDRHRAGEPQHRPRPLPAGAVQRRARAGALPGGQV